MMDDKNTFFPIKTTLNIRGNLVSPEFPMVMGILNLTPDSFYAGSRVTGMEDLLHRAEKMLSEGARILDLGACSTRPGSVPPPEKEEGARIFPALQELRRHFPDAVISVDTWRSSIARRAILDYGADMINDISAGELDKEMFATVAECRVPYLIMHMQGTPATMQNHPNYKNIVTDLMYFFSEKLQVLKEMGVHDILIDPGFGFGKTLEHNYILLEHLDRFRMIGHPLVAGLSRKSMVWKVLETSPEEALNGTTVLNTIALLKGVSILRVHDVKPAMEVIRLTTFMQKANAREDGK